MNYISLIEKYLNKKIINYQHISIWWDFEVYIVDRVIFRLPKTEEKRKWMIEEMEKLSIIKKYVSLAIPNCQIINDSFIVYPLISGIQLPDEKSIYTDKVINQLVWFMQELHSIPLSEFWHKNESTNDWTDNSWLRAFVDTLKEDLHKKIGTILSKNQMNDLENYMQELFFNYESPKKAFVHTDLQNKNIIYDETRQEITWIIDFTDSKIGWIELDFCHFFEAGDDVLRKFIEIYTGNRDKSFFERVFFLARRSIIFEIHNDEIFNTKYDYIVQKLKKYKFL